MKHFLAICFSLISTLPSLAHPGVGIVENSKGEVFYTDLKQVWMIAPDGKKSIAVPTVHTHELYLDEQGNLFGEHLWYNGSQLDTWGHYVWHRAASGKVEKIIPSTEGYLKDYSFVRDHFGSMFWAGSENACQTIVKKERDNRVSRLGTACFENIRFMHALADGSLAVVDFQDLKKVDKEGKVTTVAAKMANRNWDNSTSRENQSSVMGVWSDSRDNLYTAVAHLRQVKKFGKDGSATVAFETTFPWSPSGGMVDAQGRLWVLEFNVVNDVRVERINPDGTTRVF